MASFTGTPTHGGAPPLPPIELPTFDADEGPMRRELRRQIAVLERQHAEIAATAGGWDARTVNPDRGPAIQPGASLEEIRDELLRSLEHLTRRIERGDLAPGVKR